MKILRLVGAMALALIASPCLAQTASSVKAPTGFAPMQAPCVKQTDGSCLPVSSVLPLPTTPGPLTAASSVPLVGSFTTTTVTPTSGAATITGGIVTAGPFTPQAGRDILVQLKGANTGPAQLFTSDDNCATLDAITIGGTVSPLSSWSATPVNEVADTAAAIANRNYCLRFTPNAAGTYTVRN